MARPAPTQYRKPSQTGFFHIYEQLLIVGIWAQGATEVHLVEELAGIIWREQRVFLAERAAINRGLRFTSN